MQTKAKVAMPSIHQNRSFTFHYFTERQRTKYFHRQIHSRQNVLDFLYIRLQSKPKQFFVFIFFSSFRYAWLNMVLIYQFEHFIVFSHERRHRSTNFLLLFIQIVN